VKKEMMMPSLCRRLEASAILSISIAVGMATAASGQGTVAEILRVSYVQTSILDEHEKLVEQGTFSIAPDGRYRIDRQKDGVASAEIVDLRANRRVMLDLVKHTALTGTMMMAPIVPGSRQRPVLEQPGLPTVEELNRSTVSLGTKVVNGLVLEGTMETITSRKPSGSLIVNRAEMWAYRLPDNGIILVERRFSGDDWVDDRRIVDVNRVQSSDELFKIPAGFAVVESLR
jgi:hypothetical protein